MISGIKDDTKKHPNESIIKMINEPTEDRNKQLDELKNTMQDMKDHSSKRQRIYKRT